MEIREKQIEDILVSSPSLVQRTFGMEEEPRLIGRQIIVPSGRLDMLYTYQQYLFLIELKVATFQKRFITQVLDYKKDLQSDMNMFYTENRRIPTPDEYKELTEMHLYAA